MRCRRWSSPPPPHPLQTAVMQKMMQKVMQQVSLGWSTSVYILYLAAQLSLCCEGPHERFVQPGRGLRFKRLFSPQSSVLLHEGSLSSLPRPFLLGWIRTSRTAFTLVQLSGALTSYWQWVFPVPALLWIRYECLKLFQKAVKWHFL